MTTQVRERPILFSGEMVRAILEGRKTQTRRVVRESFDPARPFYSVGRGGLQMDGTRFTNIWCPYGARGDRLWVREAFAIEEEDPSDADHRPYRWVHYRATPHVGIRVEPTFARMTYLHESASPERIAAEIQGRRWCPSIFMPRWASRITLEITDVRVERVQDISEEDARAEGIDTYEGYARERYRDLWNVLNRSRGYSWESNPWVWVLSFQPLPLDGGA